MAAEFITTALAPEDVPTDGIAVVDVRGTRIAVANVRGTYHAGTDGSMRLSASTAPGPRRVMPFIKFRAMEALGRLRDEHVDLRSPDAVHHRGAVTHEDS